MNTNQLQSWIEPLVASHGFKARSNEWYRLSENGLAAISLEKSPYGGQHYIDIGACPIQLVEGDKHLREHECHIRARLEIVAPNRQEVGAALDLEDPTLSAEQRRLTITNAITQVAVPLLNQLQTLEGIRGAVRSHPSAFLIRPELRALLG